MTSWTMTYVDEFNEWAAAQCDKWAVVQCDIMTTLEHSDQRLVNVHSRRLCVGRTCVIHHMTDHHMRSFPQAWGRESGHVDRICPHEARHPDPDQFQYWLQLGPTVLLQRSRHECCENRCCQARVWPARVSLNVENLDQLHVLALRNLQAGTRCHVVSERRSYEYNALTMQWEPLGPMTSG